MERPMAEAMGWGIRVQGIDLTSLRVYESRVLRDRKIDDTTVN
jgi:hypothetical protein